MNYLRQAWHDSVVLLGERWDLLVLAAVTGIALTVNHYHLPTLVLRLVASTPAASGPMLQSWQQLAVKLGRGFVILVLPMLTLLLMRRRLTDFGFSAGKPKIWLRDIGILYVLMLPVVLFASTRPAFQRVYPYFHISRFGLSCFGLGLLVRLAYMFCWEFLFRGYLLFGFERRVGAPAAIAVSTIPFVIMHFGKPVLETYGSIIAGLVLGIVAIRARSFIPAAILHFAVAATLDVIALAISLAPVHA